MQSQGSYFYKYQKYRPLEKEKKFSYFIAEILIFRICVFIQKILNVLSEHSFKEM